MNRLSKYEFKPLMWVWATKYTYSMVVLNLGFCNIIRVESKFLRILYKSFGKNFLKLGTRLHCFYFASLDKWLGWCLANVVLLKDYVMGCEEEFFKGWWLERVVVYESMVCWEGLLFNMDFLVIVVEVLVVWLFSVICSLICMLREQISVFSLLFSIKKNG